MKTTREPPSTRARPVPPVSGLRARLAEAEATLHAIRLGKVDAVVVAGRNGPQVFTLQGAEHAYRMLIESMNEGALTLTEDKTVLYANRCFARMVRCPLEQLIGGSFRRFLSATDLATIRPLLRHPPRGGAKLPVMLQPSAGPALPVQISIRRLAADAHGRGPVGLVVTDLTEARHAEDLLRSLTHRVVQVQEDERSRLALELHNHITQLLCAVQFRSQALTDSLADRAGPARREAKALHRMLSHAAEEVERISRDLRPGTLDQLGLVAVVRDTGRQFADRTGLAVDLAGVRLARALPPYTELALYRIQQEALRNIEKHARARHVAVLLDEHDNAIQLTIRDDGVGLRSGSRAGLGLLAMRERAIHLGGTLTIKSLRRTGTEITASVPFTAPDLRPVAVGRVLPYRYSGNIGV